MRSYTCCRVFHKGLCSSDGLLTCKTTEIEPLTHLVHLRSDDTLIVAPIKML